MTSFSTTRSEWNFRVWIIDWDYYDVCLVENINGEEEEETCRLLLKIFIELVFIVFFSLIFMTFPCVLACFVF